MLLSETGIFEAVWMKKASDSGGAEAWLKTQADRQHPDRIISTFLDNS